MADFIDDIRDWISEASRRIDSLPLHARVEHVGTVTNVSDDVATIVGLPQTRLGEVLQLENGTRGLALSVSREQVSCVLLSALSGVSAGMRAHGTGDVARVPVGPALLGRVVDAVGVPLDQSGDIDAERWDPVERPAPAILERAVISQSLLTGITVVDAMIPLGRGQRALILGDRKTGKTSIAVDTIISQRSSNVVCVYALIGQKTTTVEQVIDAVRQHGAFDHCVFVVGEASAPPGMQWLVAYSACTIAEYFRDSGRDALLVFDDLTKHAIAYRQMSLLLRRPPGREAFPGDIFYIHSRLLERAAKLNDDHGGGSLTALPIIETQAGNLSAYIPTNLISITDGQIYLEPKLFYEGQKPAVNVGLSVSRVGSKSQATAMKKVSASLKLDYAQFAELEVFTRFGAMVDERTRKRIEHGRRIRAILAQPQLAPRGMAEQVALLTAVKEGLLDELTMDQVEQFKSKLGTHLSKSCPELTARIDRDGTLDQSDAAVLLQEMRSFAGALSVAKENGRSQ